MRQTARPAQNDGSRTGDLVTEKLSEVLDIHPALGSIHNRHRAVDRHIHVGSHVVHRTDHIGELSDAGWLNQHSLRCVGVDHFL